MERFYICHFSCLIVTPCISLFNFSFSQFYLLSLSSHVTMLLCSDLNCLHGIFSALCSLIPYFHSRLLVANVWYRPLKWHMNIWLAWLSGQYQYLHMMICDVYYWGCSWQMKLHSFYFISRRCDMLNNICITVECIFDVDVLYLANGRCIVICPYFCFVLFLV
jgi:hypothetical protein